jgi:hypothetical protein
MPIRRGDDPRKCSDCGAAPHVFAIEDRLWRPHPNPPLFRGREYSELTARSVFVIRECLAAGSFLPLKKGED